MEESQVIRELTAGAREEERILTLREKLLRVARKKFGKRLTSEDIQMIETQDDVETLDDWFNAAVDQDYYAGFRKVLRK